MRGFGVQFGLRRPTITMTSSQRTLGREVRSIRARKGEKMLAQCALYSRCLAKAKLPQTKQVAPGQLRRGRFRSLQLIDSFYTSLGCPLFALPFGVKINGSIALVVKNPCRAASLVKKSKTSVQGLRYPARGTKPVFTLLKSLKDGRK